jgi:hypothetical protein
MCRTFSVKRRDMHCTYHEGRLLIGCKRTRDICGE